LSPELRYAISALLSAAALSAVSRGGATPVDHALPFVGVVMVFLAWRCCAAVEMAVPLLVIASLCIADERARLLAFGVIVAAAFAAAVPRRFADAAGVMVAAVLVLRWIPFSQVEVFREVIVLAGAFAVLCVGQALLPVLGHEGTGKSACPTLLGAVAVALVTPTHPGKALLYPFVVAAIVFVARNVPAAAGTTIALLAAAHFARPPHAPLFVAAAVAVGVPLLARFRVALPAYVAAIALFVLWPWSGLVARALPGFFRAARPPENATSVGAALAASQSIDVPVPAGAKRAVVVASGANVARLKAGRVIGTVDALPIRIGDVADFGFLRREQFFAARNPLPALPVDDVRGYGQAAFLYGAGRVIVPRPPATLRIAAAPDLPADARLQVESVGFE
jgi:hypothetical protein